MKNVILTLVIALLVTHPRPAANLPASDARDAAKPHQSVDKFPLEERLLATIPKEYSEPRGYEQPSLMNRHVWEVVPEVGFKRPGGGWEVELSPDYSRVAYRAKAGGKVFAVVNDKKGPDFDDVRYVTFSPNGSKLAYAARLNKRWFIVTGDEKGPEFDAVGPPVFSPDGGRLAYGAESAKKEFVVVDGQKGQEFDAVSSPVFSPDGKTLAFVARLTGSKMVALFVGDKKVAEHPIISDVAFTPGGKIAYVAGKLEHMFLVVGDEKGPEFDIVFAPTFSPSGNKVAHLAIKTGAFGGGKPFVVSGDYRGTAYTVVSPPVFTPDGSKLVYLAGKAAKFREGKILLYVGDKMEESKCMTWDDPLILLLTGVEHRRKTFTVSPDGSKVACKVPQDESHDLRIAVGNELGPDFDEVGVPVFSPDGTRVGYWAREGREIRWKVMTVQ
jgi:Tol biopolymer transport system component